MIPGKMELNPMTFTKESGVFLHKTLYRKSREGRLGAFSVLRVPDFAFLPTHAYGPWQQRSRLRHESRTRKKC